MKNQYIFPGLFVLFSSSMAMSKVIPNHTAADLVLGQADFVSNNAMPVPPSATTMNQPYSVAVDPVTRKVFVADRGNSRVLRFGNVENLTNGAAAEAVIGKMDLTTNFVAALSASDISAPNSIFLDRQGRLWVIDSGHRVLRFDNANTIPSGSAAVRVYGQPDFSSAAPGNAANQMNAPFDLWIDSGDRLWVADAGNHRVLRFDNISNKPNGANADAVLGQSGFGMSAPNTGAAGFQDPYGVTVSATGALFVSSTSQFRVMRFDNAASLANGAAANAVFGAADLTSTGGGSSASRFSYVYGAGVSPDDSLWVNDPFNNRLLRFSNASTKPSGADADGVLGQPNFTSSDSATTSRGLNFPYNRPFIDVDGSVWVADQGNTRVLRFPADTTKPSFALTSKLPKKNKTKRKFITLAGTSSDAMGISKVEYQINRKAFVNAKGLENWSLKTKLRKGKNSIRIKVTDKCGNVFENPAISISS
ncbi:MAG: hypothetical protein HC845_06935 [Akkermansiaceae bacterium]|nr:hypothetical protein [Akkermansiaceae bacterium]